MSHFINIVHKCVTPELLPQYGDDTVWECDCGKKWIIWTPKGFYDNSPPRGFYELNPFKWNDKENRLKTREELAVEESEWRKRHLENQAKFMSKEKGNRWKLPFLNN